MRSERKKAQENLSLLLDNTDESFEARSHPHDRSYNRQQTSCPFLWGVPWRRFTNIDVRGTRAVLCTRSVYLRGLSASHRKRNLNLSQRKVSFLAVNVKPVSKDSDCCWSGGTAPDVTLRNWWGKVEAYERHFRAWLKTRGACWLVSSDGRLADLSHSLENVGPIEEIWENPDRIVSSRRPRRG